MLLRLLLKLLAANPSAVDAADQMGNRPLHYLAQNKALPKDVLQAFLQASAAVSSLPSVAPLAAPLSA